VAAVFGVLPTLAGVPVTESTVLGLSAVWRAVNVIAGTLGTLPLRTLRDSDAGRRRVPSVFDNPGAPFGMRPFTWKQTTTAHLVLNGNAFLAHIRNGGGGLAGLMPVHPLCVSVDWERSADGTFTGRKVFDATLPDGTRRRYTEDTMTHVTGLCLDGLRGLSPVGVARQSLGKAIAADRAAAVSYANGAMMRALVTPDEDATEIDATAIAAELRQATAGWEHANEFVVINRQLKVSELAMNHADAQFLESRQFEVQEVARWFGIPANLLMDPGAVSTWGQGVEIQNRGLSRYSLVHYSTPLEQAGSALLGQSSFVEFDYAGMERPTPEQEIGLLIQQAGGPIMTVNEARKIRNLPPVEGGDVLRTAQPSVAASGGGGVS
jgi:HK97 family phage portal protein